MIKLGYFGDGKDLNTDDISIGGLTNINWSFLKINDIDGHLTHTWVNQDKIKYVQEKYPHIKISLAIGGWGAGFFSETVASESARAVFCHEAIDYVKEYNADGIDLDWEYPGVDSSGISFSDDDKENFVTLISQLRRELDNLSVETEKEYLLTCAIGASERSQAGIDFEKLTPLFDFYNVMTYDMGGSFGTTGHQTNLHPSSLTGQNGGSTTIERLLSHGVPASKLVYGCAFYARGGNGVISDTDGINCEISGEQGLYMDYHQVLEYLATNEYTEYIDTEAIAAYAYNGDTFLTYDNEWTIQQKCEYVANQKLGGIMYWEHQTDLSRKLINIIINF